MNKKNLKGFFGLVSLELIALNLSFLITFLPLTNTTNEIEGVSFLSHYLPLLLLFNLGWALIVIPQLDSEAYQNNSLQGRFKFLLLNSLVLVGLVYTGDKLLGFNNFSKINVLLPLFLFILLNSFLSIVWFRFHHKRKQYPLNSRALIVRRKNNMVKIPALTGGVGVMENNGYEHTSNGVKNPTSNTFPQIPFACEVEDLSEVLQESPVDEIFISYSSLNQAELKQAIRTADYHGIRVKLVPEVPDFLDVDFKPSTFEGIPVYQLRHSPLDLFYNYLLKNTFDFIFALCVIICLSPIFLLLALFIYLEDGGPIFYKPIRKGERGAPFKCYKFRTMSVCDDPVSGTKSTVKDDPRITRVGKFLRKYDLDELPQFFNVVQGKMSVVGPRPHRLFLQNDFREIINEYMVRHYVKPGITGWAQVNGWRGPTKTIEQKKERVKHDLWYIEQWNLWLDIKIIFLTVFGKETRKNAF